MNSDLEDLFRLFVLSTPDARLIGDKENRYNNYSFSYTGQSGEVYLFPQRIQYDDGSGWGKGTIKHFREHTLLKSNGQINSMEKFIRQEFPHFKFDKEVLVWIHNRKLWRRICKKYGLEDTEESIGKLCYKYQKVPAEEFIKFLRKRYLSLDEYDPFYHLNLEHDGSGWHEVEIFDLIRDEFLRTSYPSLKIERIEAFDNSQDKQNEVRIILGKYKDPLTFPLVFRFEDEIVEQQLNDKKDVLDYIMNYMNSNSDIFCCLDDVLYLMSKWVEGIPKDLYYFMLNLKTRENLICA